MMPQAPRRPSRVRSGSTGVRGGPPPNKKLFIYEIDGDPLSKEAKEATRTKIQMDFELHMLKKAQEKDLHDRRVKDLKELLKTVTQDDWQYTPADKLIGLQ